MLVYLAMTMDLSPWFLKAIEKIRRAFLWRGCEGCPSMAKLEKICGVPNFMKTIMIFVMFKQIV